MLEDRFMDFIEVKGKTVNEALTNAAVELKTTSDKLECEVVSTGSAGFLGFIGSKPAIIRVRKKEDTDESWKFDSSEMIGKTFDNLRKENEKADREFSTDKQNRSARTDRKSAKPAPRRNENAARSARRNDAAMKNTGAAANNNGKTDEAKQARKAHDKQAAAPEKMPQQNAAAEKPVSAKPAPALMKAKQAEHAPAQPAEEKEEKQAKPVNPNIVPETEEFLRKLFDAMNMQDASFTIDFDEQERCMNIDVKGENMGLLIGKRGQTLDALQYIINLVVNKKSEAYIRIKLDTENYRERRRATLENLARNIAYKVKRTRKSVVLEPMNPYERRIIHSALQNDRFVETHSEGDEPYRKVVVTLKKEYRGKRTGGGRGGYNRYNGRRQDRRNAGRGAERNADRDNLRNEETAAENAAQQAAENAAEMAANTEASAANTAASAVNTASSAANTAASSVNTAAQAKPAAAEPAVSVTSDGNNAE